MDIKALKSSIWAREGVSVLEVEKCIGCGLCAEACPFNAITVADNSTRRITFEPERCGSCGFECNEACPLGAIRGIPDGVTLTFEFARCRACGRKLPYTVKEAEYMASKLREAGEDDTLVYLCDDCKRKRIFDVARSYEAYVR